MKRFWESKVLGCLGAALVALLASGRADAFIDRSEARIRTLPNGLEVLVREDPAQKVAELQVWVGTGSRDEPKGQEGIAHLFEHMLFKGTATRGVGQIAREVEAAGGDINAYTSMDHTVYHITIAAPYFPFALEVLADAVQNPAFDAAELEREKLVVVEEIHRRADNPAQVFSEKLFGAAFEVHPYGRAVIGTPESVTSVTRDDMLAFFRRWYVPANMRLVVVGGVDATEVFVESARRFTTPVQPVPARAAAQEPPQTRTRTFRLVRDTEPARVAVAFPIGRVSDHETPVHDLLAAVLSQGGSSRLPIRVRDRGLALEAWASSYTPRDPGLFIVSATMPEEGTSAAFGAILEQLASLRTDPVPAEEIERARGQIVRSRIFERERVEGQASELGYLALELGDIRFNDLYMSRLQAVDASDLMEEARRVFTPERATVGFMTRDPASPPSDGGVSSALDRFLSVPAGTRPSGRRPSIYRSVLPNGVTLLVQEDRGLPLVALRAAVLGGTRYETPQTQGSFNLLAQLLDRGTENFTAAELARRLDEMSMSLSGFAGRNSFGVTAKFLSRDAPEGFGLVREVLTRATLPEEEVSLARRKALSDITAQRDNLAQFALDLFRRTLFSAHPYGFPILGTEQSVQSLTRDGLAALYRAVVQPSGLVVSVAGDLSVEEAYALAHTAFGDLAGVPYEPGPIPQEVAGRGIRTARVPRTDRAQTHLVLGFLGPAVGTRDADALEVLNAVLAGQGGRLFVELRDRRSLAYSVFSFVSPGVDPGTIAFGIGVSPDREAEALAGFVEQIRRVRDEPVPADEVARAQRFLIGSHLIGLQDLTGRADEAAFPALYGQDLATALDYEGRIGAVDSAAIKDVARRYLDMEDYVLAVVEGGARGGEAAKP